jgi:PAS domain S-box-containing protein
MFRKDEVEMHGAGRKNATKEGNARAGSWRWFAAAALSGTLAFRLWPDESVTRSLIFGAIAASLLLLVLLRTRRLAASVEKHREVLGRLRSTEALYRSLVETNPSVTYVDVLEPGSEAGYRTRYMSPQIEGWVGYPAAAFVEDPSLWLRLVHPDDQRRIEDAHEHHYATGEPLIEEYRLLDRDGGSVWVRDHAVLVWDEDGRSLTQGVAHDITEQRRADEAKRRQEAADEANRLRSELLSRISHELRTPLNAILGFGQLLQTSDLSQDDRESADRIVHAGDHLLALVDEILEISNAPSTDATGELVDLGEIVPLAFDLVASDASRRDITLRTLRPASTLVLADRDSLQQALRRLLDHMMLDEPDGGGVTVGWETGTDGPVRIRLIGSGARIPEDQLPTLFSPFNLRSADPGGSHAGPGMDLAVAKHLIDAMGGSIEAGTTDGSPGTFEITLGTSRP